MNDPMADIIEKTTSKFDAVYWRFKICYLKYIPAHRVQTLYPYVGDGPLESTRRARTHQTSARVGRRASRRHQGGN